MRFEVEDHARFPRATVFAAHRDRLEDIVKFLPDVERVELRGRERHAGGKEVQHHHWTGSPAALPVLIRPLVPPALLQWRQVTTWDGANWRADWSIDVPGLGEAIAASGRHLYLEDGQHCRMELEGDFSFRPDRVPQLKQVPAAAVPMIEGVVVKIIVPMIQRTGEAVAKFLEQEAAGRR